MRNQQELVVKTTNDYTKFKSLRGNRKVNDLHLKRLRKSMEEEVLMSPVIVNENFEVIDGQHRIEVLKNLNSPVSYLMIQGYGLKEMQLLNSASRNWVADDFLNAYLEEGNLEYINYKKFKERYGWGHNECMRILSGDEFRSIDLFRNGGLKIKNLTQVIEWAERIEMIKPYYDGIKRRAFIYAMVKLFKNENYNHATFLGKLQYQSARLVDCTNVNQYLLLIEDIYNYRNREKISLRF